MKKIRVLGMILCLSGLLVSCASPRSTPPAEECPQPRFTGLAPESLLNRENPLEPSQVNLDWGQNLYQGKVGGQGCALCHGVTGAGNGPLANRFTPPPRNFACAKTVNSIQDGQLFWIVRNGSPGTAMPGHPRYSDTEIWQMVLYLRELANP